MHLPSRGVGETKPNESTNVATPHDTTKPTLQYTELSSYGRFGTWGEECGRVHGAMRGTLLVWQ
eukprot:9821620-Alexandrium_andersonii.AAC.1